VPATDILTAIAQTPLSEQLPALLITGIEQGGMPLLQFGWKVRPLESILLATGFVV